MLFIGYNMDDRYHFFLTVVMASVFLGYGAHEFSIDSMADFSRITDIDIAEEEVLLKTSCFSIDIAGSKESITDLEAAAYQNKLPYSLELFETNLRRESDLRRLEVSGKNNFPVTDIVLENGEKVEIEAMTGLMLAAENDIPVYVRKDFIISSGERTCMGQSLEI